MLRRSSFQRLKARSIFAALPVSTFSAGLRLPSAIDRLRALDFLPEEFMPVLIEEALDPERFHRPCSEASDQYEEIDFSASQSSL